MYGTFCLILYTHLNSWDPPVVIREKSEGKLFSTGEVSLGAMDYLSAAIRRRDQTNIQFHSFIQIHRVSKNIYYLKIYPPQNIVKPHDPILNWTHISSTIFNLSWAAEARSEVLRKHQNVPAWTEFWHTQGSHTLGLAGLQQRNVELFTFDLTTSERAIDRSVQAQLKRSEARPLIIPAQIKLFSGQSPEKINQVLKTVFLFKMFYRNIPQCCVLSKRKLWYW